jgi:predicted metal-dependent phosphoesterase TrpH
VLRHKPPTLLAELHAHTTWSDGVMSVAELAELYGRRGFDVLCVTDHTCRSDDPHGDGEAFGVHEGNFDAYLAEIEAAAVVARERYGLLVVPGLELTYNDPDPLVAAHALALGLRRFVSVEDGIERALETAAQAGAALVAAHPYDTAQAGAAGARLTQRFAHDRTLTPLVHRYELFNRTQLFPWIAEAGLPYVATGDFHVLGHLSGWKSLVPCAASEAALVTYLRSPRPVFLARLDSPAERLAA